MAVLRNSSRIDNDSSRKSKAVTYSISIKCRILVQKIPRERSENKTGTITDLTIHREDSGRKGGREDNREGGRTIARTVEIFNVPAHFAFANTNSSSPGGKGRGGGWARKHEQHADKRRQIPASGERGRRPRLASTGKLSRPGTGSPVLGEKKGKELLLFSSKEAKRAGCILVDGQQMRYRYNYYIDFPGCLTKKKRTDRRKFYRLFKGLLTRWSAIS